MTNPFDQFDQPKSRPYGQRKANPFDQFDEVAPAPKDNLASAADYEPLPDLVPEYDKNGRMIRQTPFSPPIRGERPGLGEVLWNAVRRGSADAVASTAFTVADTLDQTIQQPLRLLNPILGGIYDDPLGFAAEAQINKGARALIDADRRDMAYRIGGRPTVADVKAAPLDSAKQYGLHIANAVGESAPLMATAVATRNPTLGAAVMGGTTGAQTYTGLLGEGVGRMEAAKAAGLTAAIESAGEGFSLPAVLGARARGSLARATASEALQEAPVQVAQQYVEDQALGKETPVLQQLGDALDAALTGGAMGAGGHLAANPPGLSREPRTVASELGAAARAQGQAQAADVAQTSAIDPTVLAAGNAMLGDAVAPESMDDLDALLARNLPPAAPAPEVPSAEGAGVAATPEIDMQAAADALGLGDIAVGGADGRQNELAGGNLRGEPAAPENPGAGALGDAAGVPVAVESAARGGSQEVQGDAAGAQAPAVASETPTMQNRDRSRAASVAQMQDIRRNPDPERLGFSRDPNTGAPMVGAGKAIPDADKGRTDTVIMASGRRVPVQYAVVEADELAASHDADGRANPGYESAPLKALNNGRTAGLQAAYASGNTDAYRQGIAADAALHGVPAEAIAGKRKPVLVRLYDPAENTGDMGAESNASAQLGLSPTEQAQTDARSLPDLSGLTWSEDGSLSPSANVDFFRKWFRNIGDAQAATLQDAQGRPNALALQRVKGALVQRAYGDERLLTALSEDVNPDNRNVMNALVRAAPAFATLDPDSLAGDIRSAVVGGLELLRDANNRGLSLRDAVAQGDLLGRNPAADAIAQFMAANARSANRMAEAFKAMAEYADNSQRQAATLDVFGAAPTPTVQGALGAANIEATNDQADTGAPAGRIAQGGRVGEQAQVAGAAAGDAFQLDAQPAAPAAKEVAPPSAGLFGAPKASDFVDAARRAKDAARDGRTGTGRTDMLAGDGTLFAGPRPEQADIESREIPAQDGATYGETRPLQLGDQRGDAAAGKSVASGRGSPSIRNQLDLFVSTRNERPPGKGHEPAVKIDRAKLSQAVGLAQIGQFRSGHAVVDSLEKAAHILAPLRKSAQEQFLALVLDDAGKPLGVIRHTVGTIDSSLVEPGVVFSAIASIPGARRVVFAHNHPSGNIDPSAADRAVDRRINSLLRGSGIESVGAIIVAPGRREFTAYGDESTALTPTQKIAAAGKTVAQVPSLERRLTKIGKRLAGAMSSPAEAARMAEREAAGKYPSGVILLDTRHHVIGIFGMSRKDMSPLRTGDAKSGIADLARRVHGANAAAAFVYGQEEVYSELKNLSRAINALGVRTLDTFIIGKDGKATSLAAKGQQPGMSDVAFESVEGLTGEDTGYGSPEWDASVEEALTDAGIPIPSRVVAEKLWTDGWHRIFSMHENADAAIEVTSIDMLRNYAPDQLMALPRSVADEYGIAERDGLEDVQELSDADLTPAERASRERQSIDRKGLREQLSRQQGDADADALGLRGAVTKALGESGNKVVYLRGIEGLPENVRGPQQRMQSQRGSRMRTAGLFHPATGTVYLFTDVVKSPQMAAFTASHEIAGHQGLRALLGDKLSQVLDLAEQNPTVKAVAASMTRQRKLRGDQRYLAIEEALADLAAANRTGNWQRIADKHGIEVPVTMRSKVAAMLQNVVRRIKALFGKRGVEFTDAQVLNLLENAWQAAQGNRASMSVVGEDGALEQVVFHGTPHTVDKFSLQKIGTGEGAQAYGWGLYFAGAKDIAKHYQEALTKQEALTVRVGGKIVAQGDAITEAELKAIDLLERGERDAGQFKHNRAYYAKRLTSDPEVLALIDQWKDSRITYERPKGNLYRVDVPEDSDLLDYDKPMSQNPPAVRERAKRVWDAMPGWWQDEVLDRTGAEFEDLTGSEFYQVIGKFADEGGMPGEFQHPDAFDRSVDGKEAASHALYVAGIPGLRYLDGNSRTKGDGSANYVIWDESAIGTPESALESTEDQTQSEAFRKWFGDSKVVDAEGKPRVMYHGGAGGVRVFDPGRAGSVQRADWGSGVYFTPAKWQAQSYMEDSNKAADGKSNALWEKMEETAARHGTGVMYTSIDLRAKKITQEQYDEIKAIESEWRDARQDAEKNGSGEVYAAYLRIENPMYYKYEGMTDPNLAEQAKAKGHDGVIIQREDGSIDEIVVFRPNQIKSATGNSGAFDPTSDSILESVEYTPEQEAAMVKAGMPVDRRSTLDRAKARIMEDWQKVREAARDSDALKQAVFDRFHGLRAAEAQLGLSDPALSPYMAARMSVAQAQHVEATMLYGAPKWDGGMVAIDDNTVGLLDALKPVEGKIDAWLGWMVGRRAKLLKSQGRENNLSDADIAALLSLADGQEQAFKDAAIGYLKIKNAILDFAQEAGIIDPVARAAWDHAEYIPFYRAENEGTIGPGTRRGLAGQTAGIRTLKGGQEALADPLANIIRNFAKLIDASTKNRAVLLAVDQLGTKFFKSASREVQPATIPLDQVKKHLREQGVPEATLQGMPPGALKGVQRMLSIVPPTGENVVRVMRDGKAEYYEVLDPLVLRSLTAFKQPNRSLAVKPLIWFKRLLTTGVTTTAEFVGANFIRDSGSAWVMSDDRFKPGWDSLAGVAHTMRNDKTAKDMMMAGGTFLGGNFYDGNPDAAAAALRRALRKKGMGNRDIEGFIGTVARSPLMLWDKWMQLSGAVENANRRAVFDAAIKAGRTRAEAAFLARDLMDFNMQGDAAFIQFFSDVLPFFNARLQGLYKLGRRAGTKEGKRAILLRGGVITLASLALYAWNVLMHGDAWDELEEWDKDAYWHIAPGTPFHTRIPKPFEIGLAFATMPERALEAVRYATTGDGDKPSATWDSLTRAITGTLAFNPIPQAFLPLAEQWANKRFFTGRPIENMGDDKLLPEDRADWYTSDVAKDLGRLSGLSPKRLEHLWNGYTAGLGGYVLDSADAFARWAKDSPERPTMAPKDWPVVGRFYRGDTPGNSKYVEQFYRRFEKAEQIEQSIKAAIEAEDGARAEKLEAENKALLGDRELSKRAKAGFMFTKVKEMRKIRDAMGKLRENAETVAMSSKSPDEKRKALDEMTRQRNKLARDAIKQSGG